MYELDLGDLMLRLGAPKGIEWMGRGLYRGVELV
jgi:hypothetical protein